LKPIMKIVVIGLIAVLAVGVTAFAQGRKLPEGAYVKTAKIELSYDNLDHCPLAIAMLDSLFMHYGPHGEGMYLMTRIWDMYIEKTGGLNEKQQYVSKFAAYNDSLHATCASKMVKKKYQDKCELYIQISDSMKVKHWRVFQLAAVGSMNRLDTLMRAVAEAADSAVKAENQAMVGPTGDTAIMYATLAITIDPADSDPYLVLGSVYEKQKDYAKSTEWLAKGLGRAKDSSQILIQMAYNEIYGSQYAAAIPFFKSYLGLRPDDTTNWFNLAICYTNTKQYDSAVAVYYKMLSLAPQNTDALIGLGDFYYQLARNANDSATAAQQARDDKKAGMWGDQRKTNLDSAYAYLKKAFELDSGNAGLGEEYAVVATTLGLWEEAATAFTKLCELNPNQSSNWISLGDCYISLKKFPEAAGAYEKVIALEPGNKVMLQKLREVYIEARMPGKAAEIDKKLK
jgi:tetratricopeptide (TPR) repeat protein